MYEKFKAELRWVDNDARFMYRATMPRCIVALAFLSAAVSQPMQLTETLYEGGSCTGDAKASATLPMGTCVAVSMAYREAWGLEFMTHMVVFHLDSSLHPAVLRLLAAVV